MLYLPKKRCITTHCNSIATRAGYCAPCHKKNVQHFEKQRATATQRGYGHSWHVARTKYLKSNPLCVWCLNEGHTTAATLVDHIVPHKGDVVLFWDYNNWQSLCRRCHDVKSGQERAQSGRGGGPTIAAADNELTERAVVKKISPGVG